CGSPETRGRRMQFSPRLLPKLLRFRFRRKCHVMEHFAGAQGLAGGNLFGTGAAIRSGESASVSYQGGSEGHAMRLQMKQRVRAAGSALGSSIAAASIALAQTQTGTDQVSTTTTTTTMWYGQWWVWAVGVAVFLVIVIALTNRGGRAST